MSLSAPRAPAGTDVTTPALDDPSRRRATILLALAVFALSVGVSGYVAMNVNFINAILAASPWQQGYLESIRESCGVVSFILVALLVGRSEPRIGAVMVVMVGFGLAAYSVVASVPHLIVASLVWSLGFHVCAPLSQSMQIALARPGREGSMQGMFQSVSAAGVLVALGLVYVLRTVAGMDMRQLFLLVGFASAIGIVPLVLMPAIRAKRTERMPVRRVFERGYRLYCGLELLDGMRKQVFLLFAVLTLVREHGVAVEIIALLMFLNHTLGLVLAPLAGRLVDRFGERPVLTFYFAAVATLFMGYATVENVWALYTIFVIDNAMFVFKVALPTYASRIAARGERTSLLAMGVTMNHVGAVTLPLVGGALYSAWGHSVPFYCGAAVAAVSLVITQTMAGRTDAARTPGEESPGPVRAGVLRRVRTAALLATAAGASFACLSVRGTLDPPGWVRPLDTAPVELGAGSFARHGTQMLLHVEGTPEQMGTQHGTLCRLGIQRLLTQYVHASGARMALKDAARGLRPHLPERFVRELDACAAAAAVDPDELLVAQCEGDLLQAARGASDAHACSGYVAFGAATADGAMECGRNFDYSLGRDVARHCALVTSYRPDAGHAFVAVGVTGVLGGPTLVNEHGLVVANHLWADSAGAADPAGIPTWVLMRQIAERAATVDEAIDLIRSSRRMRNQIIWLAQEADEAAGRLPRAAAVYYDARVVEVEEARAGILTITNHRERSASARRQQLDASLSRSRPNASSPATSAVAVAYTFHMVYVVPRRNEIAVWHGATPAAEATRETYQIRPPKMPRPEPE